MMINTTSLSQTVDAVNAAQFDGRALPAAERSQVARWIASRQGLPGSYGGTFAGFTSERSKGIAAANAAWACGATCSPAALIVVKSDCGAAPHICDRCATSNMDGGNSLSGTRCWHWARWTPAKRRRS